MPPLVYAGELPVPEEPGAVLVVVVVLPECLHLPGVLLQGVGPLQELLLVGPVRQVLVVQASRAALLPDQLRAQVRVEECLRGRVTVEQRRLDLQLRWGRARWQGGWGV